MRAGAQPLLYLALGFSPEASLAIGLPLACRRPRRCCRCCASENELNTPQGERAFSILLFQDLSIVPLITIIAAMARVRRTRARRSGWKLALYTVARGRSGWSSFGRLVLNPLFRLIGRLGERELFVVAGLFTVIGASALMHAASACRSRWAPSSPA